MNDNLKPADDLLPAVTFLGGKVTLRGGDCRDVIKTYPDSYFDSVVTDPPYALVSIVKRFGGANAKPVKVDNIDATNDLKAAYARASAGFMGKQWDTGEAAWREGFSAVLIERESEYQADIAERLKLADKGPMARKARAIKQTADHGPLFGGANDNVAGGGRQQGDGRQIYGHFADQDKRNGG